MMMTNRTFRLVLGMSMGLGLLTSQSALADKSAALKRAEAAAAQVDLSDSIHASSDSQSRSLFLDGPPLKHQFEVSRQGRYRIESGGFPGSSGAYNVKAVLQNADGVVLDQAEGSERTNGLAMKETLAPGTYTVIVSGHSRSPARDGNQSVTVRVLNLDQQQGLGDENRVEQLAPANVATTRKSNGPLRLAPEATTAGYGVSQRSASKVTSVTSPSPLPDSPGPSGRALENAAASTDRQTAGQHTTGRNQRMAAGQPKQPGVAAGEPDVASGSNAGTATATTASSVAAAAGQQTASPSPQSDAEPMQRRILRDVPIREKGEVVKFEVVQPGRVVVESSTFGAPDGSYRLSAQIVDATGNVVAEDRGEGLDGDFHIRRSLDSGVYSVRVSGQKYGSARSGSDSYTLRVEQE